MHRVPSRGVALVVSASAAFVVIACSVPRPNDAEIGCAYDAQASELCPGYVAQAVDAGTAKETGAGAEAGGDAEGGTDTGLGAPCVRSSDCAGHEADYCLTSPNNAFPPFCTLKACTAQVCGTSYRCCNCAASSLPQLNSFPPNICVLPKLAAALPNFGCTCLPAPGDGG